jgi:hypothetical protein
VDTQGAGVSLEAEATAGGGASSPGLVFGDAGTVTLGPLFASSVHGGRVEVRGTAIAGGGRVGQDVELVNVVGGETSGDLLLHQSATGGWGFVGAGGDATSHLDHTGASRSMTLEANATAGTSDMGTAASPAAGGSATASVSGENSAGAVEILGSATGGEGRGAGRGGNAISTSWGQTLSNSTVNVTDRAFGGRGGSGSLTPSGDGGNASSVAIAIGAGTSRVAASSHAMGGTPGFSSIAAAEVAGASVAFADATGLGVVESKAQATGQNGAQNGARESTAVASGDGPLSSVESRVFSAGGSNGRLDAVSRIESSALLPSLGAAGSFGFPEPPAQGLAFGLAVPTATRVDALVVNGSAIDAQLATDSDALALGILGVSFATSEFEAGVELELATPRSEGLLLGLANAQAVGAGFQSLIFTIEIGGVLFFEQSFQNVSAALAFFKDTLLPVTMGDALELEIGMRAAVAAASDRFRFDFVLMTVPEPDTGSLLLVGLILFARTRRRVR